MWGLCLGVPLISKSNSPFVQWQQNKDELLLPCPMLQEYSFALMMGCVVCARYLELQFLEARLGSLEGRL